MFTIEMEIQKDLREICFRLIEKKGGNLIAPVVYRYPKTSPIGIAIKAGFEIECRARDGRLVAIAPDGDRIALPVPDRLRTLAGLGQVLTHVMEDPERLVTWAICLREENAFCIDRIRAERKKHRESK